MEGGETLPSSCSPLLATFDIGKGDREAAIANFDVLRECIHVTLLRWVKGHPLNENRLQRIDCRECPHHSRYLMVHRIGLDPMGCLQDLHIVFSLVPRPFCTSACALPHSRMRTGRRFFQNSIFQGTCISIALYVYLL